MIMNTDTTERTLEQIVSDMRAAFIDAADRYQPSTSPQTILNYHAEFKASAELLSLRLWRQFDDSVIDYDAWSQAEANITLHTNEAADLARRAYVLMTDREEGL